MPKARDAKASMVLYPSRKPVKKLCSAYCPEASAWNALPMGFKNAVTMRTAMNKRNTGFRILPTQVRILDGRREKNRTAAKNKKEKAASISFFMVSGTAGATPTWKDTVAVLGMANSGPMVRYSAQVKK